MAKQPIALPAAPAAPAAPVVVIPSDTAPFSFAVMFDDTHVVALLLRKGHEQADEAALKAEIAEHKGATLRVSVNGSKYPADTLFALPGYEDVPFRFIAAAPASIPSLK